MPGLELISNCSTPALEFARRAGEYRVLSLPAR